MKVTVPNVLGSPLTYEGDYTPQLATAWRLLPEYDPREDADSDLLGHFGYQENEE